MRRDKSMLELNNFILNKHLSAPHTTPYIFSLNYPEKLCPRGLTPDRCKDYCFGYRDSDTFMAEVVYMLTKEYLGVNFRINSAFDKQVKKLIVSIQKLIYYSDTSLKSYEFSRKPEDTLYINFAAYVILSEICIKVTKLPFTLDSKNKYRATIMSSHPDTETFEPQFVRLYSPILGNISFEPSYESLLEELKNLNEIIFCGLFHSKFKNETKFIIDRCNHYKSLLEKELKPSILLSWVEHKQRGLL